MNIEEFFKAGYKLSNMEKIRILKVTIDNIPSEWKEENTTGFLIYEGLEIMLQEIITDEYTEVDDTWPSRRWNKDRSDYIDLSGN